MLYQHSIAVHCRITNRVEFPLGCLVAVREWFVETFQGKTRKHHDRVRKLQAVKLLQSQSDGLPFTFIHHWNESRNRIIWGEVGH